MNDLVICHTLYSNFVPIYSYENKLKQIRLQKVQRNTYIERHTQRCENITWLMVYYCTPLIYSVTNSKGVHNLFIKAKHPHLFITITHKKTQAYIRTLQLTPLTALRGVSPEMEWRSQKLSNLSNASSKVGVSMSIECLTQFFRVKAIPKPNQHTIYKLLC